MPFELTDEIKQYFIGSSNSTYSAIERFDLDTDDNNLEDALISANIERCPGCDWWYESHELVNAAGDVVGCSDCSPRDADE